VRRSVCIAWVSTLTLSLLYLNNASWLAASPLGKTAVLAHRGIHQTFPHKAVTRDTCTARIIDPPTNPYLENTIASMRASFAAGADALELDIQPTTDGDFAVFHDWSLECRTNGRGVTRRQNMAYLRTLDIGHGYTADGGRSFPFRGKGIGQMPTLAEVFAAFPGRRFLINVKSNDPHESDRLIAYLKARRLPIDERLWIFADGRPAERLAEIAPSARVMSKKRLKACSMEYVAYGWTGIVPDTCRGNFIAVPTNWASWFWGWPNRLASRMAAANTLILIVGPTDAADKELGVSRGSDLAVVPPDFPAYIVTDNIETIGPAVRAANGS
jgi:glycerophosphoryl diester phosphodiesterase